MATNQDRLDSLVTILNRELNRPLAAYEKRDDGRYVAQIGNLSLSPQSPGDGRTRYTLEEIVSDGGAVRTYWTALGRSEANAMLRAMLDTFRLIKG